MSLTETTATPVDTHAEDTATGSVKWIYLVLLAVVVAWGSAIYAYGIPGLYLPALALVPAMYALLVIIAKG